MTWREQFTWALFCMSMVTYAKIPELNVIHQAKTFALAPTFISPDDLLFDVGAHAGTTLNSVLQFVSYKDENHILRDCFLKDIQQRFGRSIFVETGTYCGDTVLVAASIFSTVYSVELSETLYKGALLLCKNLSHVFLYNNHSPNFLNILCPKLKLASHETIFWFDAHESGGVTTHYQDQLTPIVDELTILANHSMADAVILIDDMRCFGSTVNNRVLFAHEGYPSFQEICTLLYAINPRYKCILLGDILVAYDVAHYDISISPVVQACTYSRLYNVDDFSEEILIQENYIAQAVAAERAMIDTLYQRALNCEASAELHAYLWYGLIMAIEDPLIAYDAFSTVINKGYNHWRIYWYLAQVAHASANYVRALDDLNQVLALHPNFQPAMHLKTKVINEIASSESLASKGICDDTH